MSEQVHKWQKMGRFYLPPDGSDWRCSHAQLPVVDTHDRGRWRIYYSTRNELGQSLPAYFDVEPERPENILCDPRTPLLELGPPGAFDEHGIMPTAVVREGSETWLYYIGWSRQKDVPYRNAIGLAKSGPDGKFEKYSQVPVIGPSSTDPLYTGTLNILREGNLWRGYYMSCLRWQSNGDQLDPIYHLRYAESNDGIQWQREGRVVIDFKSRDEGGIVAATAQPLLSGAYGMWYCYRSGRDFRSSAENSYRIGFAESHDAVHWERRDELSGIGLSDSGWDSQMQCYPCVVSAGNSLFLFYNGNGFGQSGIGYAKMERI